MKKFISTISGIALAMTLSVTTFAAQRPIELLEPVPNGTPSGLTEIVIDTSQPLPPLSILNAYLNPFIPWAIGVSAGLAILMIILGGFQIMLSGGGDIKNSAGTKRIMSAIFGLLILVFSATILNWLNANYFRLI
ncbi:hypothetical protein HOF56_02395 [Candidatus Peribacteria bacterium]|jgi:hypothetical protein|nr:hypothetical protein [Candidatus Peribacteria bacterium]MBT4021040.1 hypothetical protein [Candidatus Peribacteria bacterium]MBT4240761.1 hypothetical protein [Candidatus Peribacteria bacterium]MBT4474210.1 hypothetical protein [Candidatus Peribacteria bacterium]